jgi:hypothetical protein
MQQAFDDLMAFLEGEGYHVQVLEPGEAVRISLSLDHATYRVLFTVCDEVLAVHAFADLRFPASTLPVLCEFAARVNDGMRIATLDVDLDDRDVSCRATSLVIDRRVPPREMEVLLDVAVRGINWCYPGLGAIAFGGASASEAYARFEELTGDGEADD